MSRRTLTRGLAVALAVVLVIFAAPLLLHYAMFKDQRITEGAAYGFVIGETKEQTFIQAMTQLERGEISEFRLGHGSGAIPLGSNGFGDAAAHDSWQLTVDPDLWNDSVYLTFEDGRLTEIWRFRMYGEMP